MQQPDQFELDLPDWLKNETSQLPEFVPSRDERMRLVIKFSRMNFEQETGGPFAAGIFERDSGRVVAFAVNRVVPCNASIAHAEIVAMAIAQKRLGTFDLGGVDLPAHELVVNGRPCAMCFGAIPWSGIKSLVVGASGEQIEELTGFDEGPIHPDWKIELTTRGIEVFENVLAEEACQVFRDFKASDPVIYNGRQGQE